MALPLENHHCWRKCKAKITIRGENTPGSWHICLRPIFICQIIRNKAKLQAYQREYAREKRAPGRRRVSKKERELLQFVHWHKNHVLRTHSRSSLSLNVAPPPSLSQ